MWQSLGAVIVHGGPWGLVGLVVVSLIRGWLIPATTHDRIVAALERQLQAEEKRADEFRAQVAILVDKQSSPRPVKHGRVS